MTTASPRGASVSIAISLGGQPAYSVIVPAYNEVEFLPATLSALAAAMERISVQGEIIVVDNNSDDGTAEIATLHGVRVVHEPVNQISRARNTGAANAVGEYFVFVDADTLISERVLTGALDALMTSKTCGGGARVAIEHSNRIANATVAFWNWFAGLTKLAAGCFVFVRRDAFVEVGGFSEQVYASEEIWLSLALKRWGKSRGQSFIVLEESVLTSARKLDWLSTAEIIKQTAMILIFPLAIRSRRLCSAWYRRPRSDGSGPDQDNAG